MENPKDGSKHIKIIIAEDDAINQRLMFYHLKEITENLLFAGNGFEAIDLFEKNSDVSLILMDLRMPGMNGVEATKKILDIDANARIIALSAFSEEESGFDVRKSGFLGYLTKPVSKDKLLEAVKKYIE